MTTKVTVHANGQDYPAYVYRGRAQDDPEIKLEATLTNETAEFHVYQDGFIMVTEVDLDEAGLLD